MTPKLSKSRQRIGFSPEIETIQKLFLISPVRSVDSGLASHLRLKHGPLADYPFMNAVASGLASHLRLKPRRYDHPPMYQHVASGLASHLRLKPRSGYRGSGCCGCRQRIGFSPEIETVL